MQHCFPNFTGHKDHIEVLIKKRIPKTYWIRVSRTRASKSIFFTSTPREFHNEGSMGPAERRWDENRSCAVRPWKAVRSGCLTSVVCCNWNCVTFQKPGWNQGFGETSCDRVYTVLATEGGCWIREMWALQWPEASSTSSNISLSRLAVAQEEQTSRLATLGSNCKLHWTTFWLLLWPPSCPSGSGTLEESTRTPFHTWYV